MIIALPQTAMKPFPSGISDTVDVMRIPWMGFGTTCTVFTPIPGRCRGMSAQT